MLCCLTCSISARNFIHPPTPSSSLHNLTERWNFLKYCSEYVAIWSHPLRKLYRVSPFYILGGFPKTRRSEGKYVNTVLTHLLTTSHRRVLKSHPTRVQTRRLNPSYGMSTLPVHDDSPQKGEPPSRRFAPKHI
jgi:hypothetical protein